ncbi:hypothetical protein ABKN59_007835 [Abortiporus biennis]
MSDLLPASTGQFRSHSEPPDIPALRGRPALSTTASSITVCADDSCAFTTYDTRVASNGLSDSILIVRTNIHSPILSRPSTISSSYQAICLFGDKKPTTRELSCY